eukprot:CAMPEP_0113895700 /NCGR_PEP_ID=MMETSP0780_2-20120614/17531_1 /TAXON_ID=652834 /ORGANISM="Palpitomonas bilix" /LENGTH=195 /DNA_ID=CAMNT_0000886605 /DNA_START=52 /DNA_END=635 /DNA_ORIENTATION=- /assembly_acc=CAM_ASM_000599
MATHKFNVKLDYDTGIPPRFEASVKLGFGFGDYFKSEMGLKLFMGLPKGVKDLQKLKFECNATMPSISINVSSMLPAVNIKGIKIGVSESMGKISKSGIDLAAAGGPGVSESLAAVGISVKIKFPGFKIEANKLQFGIVLSIKVFDTSKMVGGSVLSSIIGSSLLSLDQDLISVAPACAIIKTVGGKKMFCFEGA